MFNRHIDIVVHTHLVDIIEKRVIEKAAQPSAFRGIKQESECPFSKFASKFTKATIRSCDGANALFEKSLLVKSCADFHFEASDSSFNWKSASRLFDVSAHDHNQIQVTPFKFYPKIMYPAFIEAKNNVQLLLHKAYYHTKNDRVYPTGIVGGTFNPNVIFELEPNTEDFIEYLEPLVYFTALTDKKIKLHYELITEQQYNDKRLKLERRRFARHTI